jgi:hypothetical protein
MQNTIEQCCETFLVANGIEVTDKHKRLSMDGYKAVAIESNGFIKWVKKEGNRTWTFCGL